MPCGTRRGEITKGPHARPKISLFLGLRPRVTVELKLRFEKMSVRISCARESIPIEKACIMSDTHAGHSVVTRLRTGRDSAVAQVVDRYTERLLAVAGRQIGRKLARRIDAEDILQSTYRSFFRRTSKGEYELDSESDLWRLLVTITLNKVRRQAKFHTAARRDMLREHSAAATSAPAAMNPRHGMEKVQPPPSEVAVLNEEMELFLGGLRPRDRAIVTLRLEGYSTKEIATQLSRAERSVRRVLHRIHRRLEATASTWDRKTS